VLRYEVATVFVSSSRRAEASSYTFTVATTADVSTYAGKTIVITAYAVQADGFASAQDAWDYTFGA
jgi:hypothetical protein